MGGCCSSCFPSGSHEELLSPDLVSDKNDSLLAVENHNPIHDVKTETRRRQLAEAAETRAKQNESRGLSNPERVQRKIEQARAREDKMDKYGSQSGSPALKWQAN